MPKVKYAAASNPNPKVEVMALKLGSVLFKSGSPPPPESHHHREFDYLDEVVDVKVVSKEHFRIRHRDYSDRISDLPDDVLLHIMSLMDTKCAVRTCVLSNRWTNLCKCLTSLSFVLENREFMCDRLANFERFVSWVVSGRDDSYPLLNLDIVNQMFHLQPVPIIGVIKYALVHSVEHLKVDLMTLAHIYFMSKSELLPQIFCCQSLKSLQLSIRLRTEFTRLILPKSLNTPALQSLHISYVKFTASDDEYAIADPFSNCHVLNTLVLEHCSLDNDKQVLRISNPTLSSLTIFEGEAYRIELSTPNVRFVTFKGSVGHQLFSTRNLSFLEEANIFIYGDDTTWDGKGSIIVGWLHVFANAKMLTFSLRAFRVILSDLSNPGLMMPQPPCFVRLESLKVKKQWFADISFEELNRVVDYLLQNSPTAKVDIPMNA